METNQEAYEDEGSRIPQADLLKSYLAFALRAVSRRKLVAASIFLLGAALTALVTVTWPRTYHCEMKLMAMRNQVLAVNAADANPLASAGDVIGRHDNLRTIVQQSDLVRDWELGRSPVLKFKDRLLAAMRGGGKISDDDLASLLVATVEGRISVNVWDNTLSIGADWTDPNVAERLVEAARQVFMESRHTAEVSTVQEKITILEGHASKLREEIDRFADQLQRVREERLAQAGRVVNESRGGDAPASSAAHVIIPRPRPHPSAEPDEQLPLLKEELDAKKKSLADLEADRNRRLTEAQAKLTELAPKYTPAHPLVRAAEQNIEALSQESPRVAALKAEVQSLEAAIKARAASAKAESAGGGGGVATGSGGGATPGGDLGSADILKLVDSAMGVDPGISAQLQGTLAKYGALKDAVGTARIDLDEAQAAFNYRYKVIVPPEVPGKPIKPKVPMLLAVGLLIALVVALLIPIAAELRSGIVVERWQIYHLDMPILTELKYPPGSSD
jgi:hypothetical protein